MSRAKQTAPFEYPTTNQLEFLKNSVMNAMMQHRHSLPFRNSKEGNVDLVTILPSGDPCSGLPQMHVASKDDFQGGQKCIGSIPKRMLGGDQDNILRICQLQQESCSSRVFSSL